MLNIKDTTDTLRVVTSAAANVVVHVDFMKYISGAATPDRKNTAAIVTATNTTILGPAASTGDVWNAAEIIIVNNHASAATTVTVQHLDGTNTNDVAAANLLAGEMLLMDRLGAWHHYDSNLGEYTYNGPPVANLEPTGVFAATIPRELCTETNTTGPTTGVLYMQAIALKAGQLVSNIGISSATTAAVTPTHFMIGLFDKNRNLLATSADQTTAAWAANTYKSIAMATPYRVPTSDLYYIGFFQTAATMNTWKGQTARTGGQLASQTPILGGLSSSTGLTTALPNPAGALTANGTITIYANVS